MLPARSSHDLIPRTAFSNYACSESCIIINSGQNSLEELCKSVEAEPCVL